MLPLIPNEFIKYAYVFTYMYLYIYKESSLQLIVTQFLPDVILLKSESETIFFGPKARPSFFFEIQLLPQNLHMVFFPLLLSYFNLKW